MLRLRRYEQLSVQNRPICSNRGRLTQNFMYKVSLPTNHSSSQKARLNPLSYDIKLWTDLSSVLSQSMRLTDRRTEFSSLDCVCIPCSAVKTQGLFLKSFAGRSHHCPKVNPSLHLPVCLSVRPLISVSAAVCLSVYCCMCARQFGDWSPVLVGSDGIIS